MRQSEEVLDSAALAAQTISGAANISDPDAMAQKLLELEGRIKELETAVPAVMDTVDRIYEMIPKAWVAKVQQFLSQHLGFRE